MRNKLLVVASTLVLAACQTTGTDTQSGNVEATTSSSFSFSQPVTKIDESQCNAAGYAAMPGPEFSYIGQDKYSKLYFNVASDSSNYKYTDADYVPLIGAKFKFTGILAPKEFKSQNPYKKVTTIDDVSVEFESNIKSAIITESCHAYWFRGHTHYGYVTGEQAGTLEKTDKTKVTVEDFKFAYGPDNVKAYEPKAKIDVDKFAKTATITTEYQDSLMLRAWSDSNLSKMPKEIQIYTEIMLLDWANFDRAISDDGNKRTLVRIDTDVRNCGGIIGCQLYETVGVSVPLSYVKKNKDGFEVQVYGQQKKVIKVPKYQITSMLEAINKIK
ncbi:hypothetical protein MT390_13915 [Vibrio sp. 2-Bac 85]